MAIVGDTAARSAQGKSGPNDERKRADIVGDFRDVRGGMGDARERNVETDAEHGFFKGLAILALRDGLGVRAD